MIHVERDRTGVLARLECDACHAQGVVLLVGNMKLWKPGAIQSFRAWLRDLCRGMGWGQRPAVEEGGTLIVDLCDRCRRKGGRAAKRRRTG